MRKPHAPSTFGFGIIGRVPMAMNTVAIVFLVSDVRDSFALAGITSAFYTLAGAIVSPRIGKLADRFGTRSVLIPVTLINALAMLGLLFFIDRSTVGLFALAAIFGATFPNFGSYTRTRWSRSITDDKELSSALSLESVFDETAFVVGPALAGFLFALYGSRSPLLAGIVFVIIGGIGLAITSTDHGGFARVEDDHSRGILSIPYVKSLLLSLVAMGLLFGSNFVVIIAVATEGGRASDGGLWVGLYPLGSAVSGLIYGFIHWKISSTIRYTVSLAVMTVCTSGILFFQDLDTIAFWIIVSGIAIGPALISANAFMKELVPLSRLNESFAFLGAAISIGITIGSTLSGVIVEEFDGWKGFYFMTAATALATVISCFGWGFHKEEVATDESNS
jgi:MFS family permease|uniref:MFS transporter n=1 Tax=Candidatus Planktophila sp. TaxID=2175601 RepID=UPI00404A02E7